MKTMSNSTQKEKYRWIKPILKDEIVYSEIIISFLQALEMRADWQLLISASGQILGMND